jgi:hypothetical protein
MTTSLALELRCRRCAQPYRPSRNDLARSRPHFWYCDACRRGEPRPKTPPERPRPAIENGRMLT